MTTPRLPRRTPPAPYAPSLKSEQSARSAPPSGVGVLALPAALAIGLGALAFRTADQVLVRSLLGAAGVLLVWCATLLVSARRGNRALSMELVLRPQHWMQAIGQGTLILYVAYHTPLYRALLPLIAIQLVFAYAFDSLLSWSRRDRYTLGFGPFPIIFSINLFLSFRAEWFYWQLVLVAVGFAAKEFIRWRKDGRPAHIFNPSSFPLAVAAVALLLAGQSQITFGNAIANAFADTPHIYLAILLVALPGQLLFGVTRVTIAAVITAYVIGLGYYATTGTYLMYDAFIPPAVFIGMHLLVTDPATSPKTEPGRLLFGALYGLGATVAFALLESAGAPTFWDKLLPIPILNLMVRRIDAITQRSSFALPQPAAFGRLPARVRPNVLYTSLWVALFVALTALRQLGDEHAGQYLPFWYEACRGGSTRACGYVVTQASIHCRSGSGWSCNEVGLVRQRRGEPAAAEFRRACQLGFAAGCENLRRSSSPSADGLERSAPALRDLPILLAGSRPPLDERDPAKLYALACDQGWRGACAGDLAPQP